MSRPDPERSLRLRLDGWGEEGVHLPPSPAMLQWLEARLGAPEPFPRLDLERLEPRSAPTVSDLGCETSGDFRERLAHSRGRGFSDLVRLRSGTVPTLPAAVARPRDADQVRTLLTRCADAGCKVVPWGGGTSVTGGVNPPAEQGPVITSSLRALSGLRRIDEESGLATFGAGTLGPEVEAALAPHGWTLGHFPQSWELSTVGGWVATRSAGQESLGYGRIESLVAGLELVAPAHTLELPPLPATAAGPDLRQMVLGSEGRFGVITEVTLRVRRLTPHHRFEAFLLPDWERGRRAARRLVQDRLDLTLLRLSDGPETQVAMAIGLTKTRLAPLVKAWLRLRRIGPGACLLLLGARGTHNQLATTFDRIYDRLRPHGAASLGEGPGRNWQHDRFRHPYLRDSLLDRGYATDTFETAAPWSRLGAIYRAVRQSLTTAVEGEEREIPVLCHLSHPYADGASLYFTFFFRCPRDPEAAIARWADLKRRATGTLVEQGATLSHHHGIGAWHAPWLPRESGPGGHQLLARMAAEMDPHGTLNPHVLLDPEDRLED